MAYNTYSRPAKSGPLGRLPDLKQVERSYGIYEETSSDAHTVSYPSGGSAIRTLSPGNLDAGTERIMLGFRQLFRARTMQEHCDVMGLFARDMVWDAPPILLGRKGHMRVAAYLAKFVASLDVIPDAIKVHALPDGRHVVEVIGVYAVYPKRTWLVWPTLLAPRVLPLKATVKLGVNGPLESGQIELLWGRIHNAPVLPSFVRAYNGLMMGVVPHVFEPVWGWAADVWGDSFYSKKRHGQWKARHPDSSGLVDRTVDTISDLSENTIDYSADVVKGVQGYIYYFFDLAMGAARTAADTGAKAAGTVVGVAGAATQGALNAAGTVVNTAEKVAGTAYNVGAGAAGAVYGGAAAVGNTVYDTAAPIAAGAVNTASNVANSAVETAAGVANQAKDTAAYAADRAVDAAQQGYDATKQTASYAADRAYGAAQQAYDVTNQTAAAAVNTAQDTAARTYNATTDAANTAYYKTAETADAVKGTTQDTAYRAYDNANIAAQKTKAAAANGVNAAAGAAAGAVQGAKVGAYSAQRVPVTDTGLAANVAESQVNKGTVFEGTGGRVVGQNRRM
jgi:hypothetical protein